LLVIPAVFTYVDDLAQWFARVVARLSGRPHPHAASAPQTATR
jgi:hypothetical protein